MSQCPFWRFRREREERERKERERKERERRKVEQVVEQARLNRQKGHCDINAGDYIYAKMANYTITITHDMSSARKIATKVAMLYQGKIIWHGDVKDIDNSGNPYVEQFIKGSATGPIKMEVRN